MQQKTRGIVEELLSERILLLDGSMGAYIYAREFAELVRWTAAR